ncbi:MAG: hypothetical protein ACP5MU_00670 [Thermoplasmata archaeon]
MASIHYPFNLGHYINYYINPVEAIIILLIGVILIFFGSKLWKYLTAIIGAIFGYLFYTDYLFKFIPSPYYLIGLVVTVLLFALIAGFVARIAISFLLSLAILSLFTVFLSLMIGIIAFFIAFIIFYILYKKIIILLSALTGASIIFGVLVSLGLNIVISTIISFILLIMGLIYQIKNNEEGKQNDREVERI